MVAVRKKPIYAFIDSQNLNLGVRSQGWKLDFTKFRKLLSDRYQVTKAFLFIGFIKEQQLLYNDLKRAGYTMVFKPTITHNIKGIPETKGNVDAELVLHSMIQFSHYSKAVIVSGDGDFHCLIEYLDSKNKLSKILVPNPKYSSLLRRFASHITQIQLFRQKIQLTRSIKTQKKGIR